jgi:hypothetical protein
VETPVRQPRGIVSDDGCPAIRGCPVVDGFGTGSVSVQKTSADCGFTPLVPMAVFNGRYAIHSLTRVRVSPLALAARRKSRYA